MRYAPALSRESQRYLRQSPPAVRGRLRRRIERLCEDPFDTVVSKPLHGSLEGKRSSRVGDLRILYEVLQEQLLISIVRIGPRGDVYGR